MVYSPLYEMRGEDIWCLVCDEHVYSWTARGNGQQKMFHINEKHPGLKVEAVIERGKKVWYYGHD